MNLRALAAQQIHEVCAKGISLADSLPLRLAELADARDRALVQEMVYGVLRHRRRLQSLREKLLAQPLKNPNGMLASLLLVGLYQLLYLRVPAHAAVSETVNACEDLDEGRARGLVNAVLRRAQREAAQLLPVIDEQTVVRYSHPDWLLAHWRGRCDIDKVMEENNAQAPMTLRVNRQRISVADYQQQLQAIGISAHTLDGVADALVLEQAVDPTSLPGFDAGLISVQDAAAQLAAGFLDLQPHLRVLDACCAPGGKTVHMLEREPTLEVVAVDSDAQRLPRVRENLARAQVNAQCIVADVAAIDYWWDKKPFDRILCDAPCSATGVIRRHPDIKWLRRERDVAALAKTQLSLLQALWKTLAVDGLLLYATCSTLAAENDEVIQRFLETTPDAKLQPLDDNHNTWQIWPGENQMDGFFYARLRKNTV